MAYAFVGKAINASNANTITYSPTAGNYLVVVSATSAGGGSPTATIADGHSGSWTTQKAAVQDDGDLFYSVYTCGSAASGVTTVTLTYNGGTPGNTYLAILEYSGLSPTGWIGISAFKNQTAPGAGANAITSNSVNVTTQPAALIGWINELGANGGTTAGTSPLAFTIRVTTSGVIGIEDARVTATGNASLTATNTAHGGADGFTTYVMAISEPAIGPSLGFVTGGGAGGTNINTSPSGVATSGSANNFYLTVVAAGGSAATTSPTITDTYSNTWTQIGSIFNPVSNAFYVSRFYCQNANGGANHQFTATWGGSLSAGSYLAVGQLLNCSTTALYAGQSNQATYNSTTANPFTSGNVTVSPPAAGSLLLSTLSFGLATASEGTITEANGFALAVMPSTTFTPNSQLGSLAESSAGTYNASWSSTQANTSNTSFVAIIDTFNGAGALAVSPLMMGAKQTFVTDIIWQY
jgi:hypothetical protein